MSVMLIETHVEVIKKIGKRVKRGVSIGIVILIIIGAWQSYVLHDRGKLVGEMGWINHENEILKARVRLLGMLRTRPLTVGQALDVVDSVVDQCAKSEVPINIVLALFEVESEFWPYAVSNKGAIGLGQLMPATFALYFDGKASRAYDPSSNVRATIMHIADLRNQYGDWKRVLRVYNGGPNYVNTKDVGVNKYVAMILRKAGNYEHE